MGKKSRFSNIPLLDNTIQGGLADYINHEKGISLGENIDGLRGNLIGIHRETENKSYIRIYKQEETQAEFKNADKDELINSEILQDIDNKLNKNKTDSISDFKIARLLSDENNFLLMEGNLYYGERKLGYYQGVTPQLAETIIRKITPLKYKPSITSRRIREIVNWFHSFEELVIEEEILNSNKTFINFLNCVVDARDGIIYEKSLDYCFTNFVNAEYPDRFTTRGKTFEKFMGSITGGNPYLYNRLQEIFGYVLSDIRDLKIILYFVGPKDSGKSVVINLLEEIVGKEFCTNLSLHDMSEKFRLGKLYKKKLNCCGETGEINLKRTDIIKAVSGNDTILAEEKNISPFSFTNKAALLFAGNELPRIVGLDKTRAFSDRLIIVPFNFPTEKRRQDINLVNKLIDEKSYIVKWALDGLKRLIENNYVFTSCDEVEDIYNDYLRENNSVQTFIDEQCIKDPRYKIHTVYLEEAYREYCYEKGIIPVDEKAFHKSLKQIKGIIHSRFRLNGENLNGYIGLKLDENGT
ncbi:phage/plasmid primase, P4 family [Mesobacillus jeotgali]|uniref:DNA primase family protein n=1 Tax=Mesobacillus jeotgali TaxID=129985 RepID=UPI001780A163|nr:phage/plasmid primase, P4 family [Mesobacillus jeotgali]UYZ22034.1 phage/plasmid primase, P4 family [Mesobacillus jeotgali]